MARAKRDPEGRKRAIVEAATDLVLELGPSHVTHRKVAERAGVPLGATTQYFASLDDLIASALTALVEEYDAHLVTLAAELDRGVDPAHAIARYLLSYAAAPDRARAEAAFFVANIEAPALGALTDDWYARQHSLLTRHLSARAATAVETYGYGLCMQLARGEALPDEDDLAWVLTRLTDYETPNQTQPKGRS